MIDFTAQADHQYPGEIDVVGIAAQGALEDLDALALGAHAATAAMGDGDHAVNIGVIAQTPGVECRSDLFTHRGRAIDAGNHPDVVARADPAICTYIAGKPGLVGVINRGLIDVGQRLGGTGRRHLQVVHMDVVARSQGSAGLADDLPVLAHRLPLGDTAQGDFMP